MEAQWPTLRMQTQVIKKDSVIRDQERNHVKSVEASEINKIEEKIKKYF